MSGFQFQRFSSLASLVGHGGVQADVVLEKELRVLYLELKVTGSGLRHWT